MKFKTYLETIAGVEIFPLISLIIFFAFFLGLLVYIFALDKKALLNMKNLPLQDGSIGKTLFILLLSGLMPALAEEEAPVTRAVSGTDLILYVLLAALGLVIIQLVILLVNALATYRKFRALTTPEPSRAVFSEYWWRKFRGVAVPLQDEKSIVIEGHDYDGITELDNRMPPWLQFLFLSTIVFAIAYATYYFSGLGDMQLAELDKEVAQAELDKKSYMEKVGASLDESSVTLLTDKAGVEAGKAIFQEKCTACHGAEAGGGVGPNLTDPYWLHGSGIRNLFKVIKYGVPEKGMIAWEKQLSPVDIQKVASYVLSIQGTKPANAKEPQGDMATESPVAVK
ncbi:cbb3-type cytochrome c oxidase N-terminal domain-containing protein [Dyadobacter sandarakinus]|uniref:C-type cytochrome n=1 Tax=Dyadobacter sandarakinus TaxID=2747268 RepID=A0ABX7I4P4_9BACT|nr:cbb3-type cytochrome c oxidase N-terminal domain-containing protein [Dyadobacter sandarakinus]QRR00905.1 c-type cytochrome [Dyadobacter sandarakinus]